MTSQPARQHQIAAYFPEWSPSQNYFVKNIAETGSAEKLTIINYAFGIPAPRGEGGEVICTIDNPSEAYARVYSTGNSVDGEADNPGQPLRGHFNQLLKLKRGYPQIRVVVSLGGWTGSGWFSVASRTETSRKRFVASCVDLYLHGNLPLVDGAGGSGTGKGVFDGIDIDWEYPVGGGLPENHVHPDDAENFVLLLKEFREQLAAAGRPDFLLTMAGPGPGQARQFNLHQAHGYLDLVAMMTYDFRGAWSKTTGHHTNLCASIMDPAPVEQRISADRTVRIYRDEFGVPAEKLMLGAAFYGRVWRETAPERNGLFQPGVGASEAGSGYRDLRRKVEAGGYLRFWDESAKAPWLYHPGERIFWTYDDEQSIGIKSTYARYHRLAGIMFWDITGDDDAGTLVKAVAQGLHDEAPAEDPCR